jgi:hypothetical protein
MPRKTEVAYALERATVMRNYLELGMALRDYIFEHDQDRRDFNAPGLTWVAAAVAMGHAEKRPMTATRIADFLKLDRVTVKRRLDQLIEMKIIVRDGDEYFIPKHRAAHVPHATLRRYAQAFVKAAKVLADFAKKILGVQSERPDRST